jgi:Cu2+-exporting ATPase/Cu+-exporting ATPase
MPTDPVCGMFVPEDTDLKSVVDGQTYYFCSKTCQQKYSSPETEDRRLKRRLIVGWSLSIPVIVITYGFSHSIFYLNYVLLILTLPVQFYSGYGFYEGSYHALKSRSANMDLLVSLGTLTAFVFSAYVTIARPSSIPPSEVYFDASSFIVTLILTGNFIENLTKVKANRAASKLIGTIPNNVHYISSLGDITDKKTDEIRPGDKILVKPGEVISVDGIIFEGKSEVDESMLTGEQEPILKFAGQVVASGTKNLNGVIRINVTRTGKDSTVSQIYELIQRAISGRVKVQRIADVFSSAFVPVVISSALVASLFWYFYLSSVGYPLALEIGILAFVSVVVIACPCAIGLAGPITLLIASNVSSENGIIMKNASALDRLSRATRAIFDKTGTLTESDPVVTGISVSPGGSEENVIALAASVESASNHPIARAIVALAENKKVPLFKATEIKEIPGVGITGSVNDKEIRVSRAKREGGSTVSVNVDNEERGLISLSYVIRKEAISAIKGLRSMGIRSSMITGDSMEEARRVGNQLGIDDIHAEVLPADKSEIIKKYQAAGDYVIFTGDGINDTVALETADVGIAMGSGTDIARESGDIILLKNDLNDVVYAKIIGKKTIGKVKQNIGWAFGYNTALIPVAGGVLVPLFGLSIYSFLPILSALAMGMSSTSVVLNSLLLRHNVSKLIQKYERGVIVT